MSLLPLLGGQHKSLLKAKRKIKKSLVRSSVAAVFSSGRLESDEESDNLRDQRRSCCL